MGRGVNMDDGFLGGYNYALATVGSNSAQILETIATTAITSWKANFLRISLYMDSGFYSSPISWTGNTISYTTLMTNVIKYIAQNNPSVYILITLRSDSSMVDQDTADGDAEATGLPASGTDAVYTALVDAFGSIPNVLFGLSNEPGGDKISSTATIAAAMTHAVSTIRAEETAKGYHQHLISVQGNDWTSDLSYYATTPLSATNVVYELHYYPANGVASTSYSSYCSKLPIVVGEYGPSDNTDSNGGVFPSSFFTDMENDHISSLAWDIEPYNEIEPALLNWTSSSDTNFVPTAWGTVVKNYLANP